MLGARLLINLCLPLHSFRYVVTIFLGLPLHIRALQFLHDFHSCLNSSLDVRPFVLLGEALSAD